MKVTQPASIFYLPTIFKERKRHVGNSVLSSTCLDERTIKSTDFFEINGLKIKFSPRGVFDHLMYYS